MSAVLRLSNWTRPKKAEAPPLRVSITCADGRVYHYDLRKRPLPLDTGQTTRY